MHKSDMMAGSLLYGAAQAVLFEHLCARHTSIRARCTARESLRMAWHVCGCARAAAHVAKVQYFPRRSLLTQQTHQFSALH